jgi:hypothetical protein
MKYYEYVHFALKLTAVVINSTLYKPFVKFKHNFHPSLIFVSKSGANPILTELHLGNGVLPIFKSLTMEHHVLKNANICWNTKITFYSESSIGLNSNLYLNVHFFQLKC